MDLFAPTSGSMLVIGVGSLGGRVASAGAASATSDAAFKALWSAVHVNAAELISTGLDKKLLLKIKDGPFAARSAAVAIEEHAQTMAHWLSGKSVVFLVASRGERAASLLIPPLAGVLRKFKDLLVVAVVCDDPVASGQSSEEPAACSAGELNCDIFIRVPEELTKSRQKKTPLMAARAEIETRLLHVLEALGGALAAEIQGTGFCANAFKSAVTGSGPLSVSAANAHGPNAASEAAEKALNQNTLLNGDTPIEGAAAALTLGREPSVAEVKAYSEMFRSRVDVPVLIGFSTQPLLEDEAFCVVIARGAGSRNVVRLTSTLSAR